VEALPFVPLAPVRSAMTYVLIASAALADIAVPARRGHRELAAFRRALPLLLGSTRHRARAPRAGGVPASKLARQRGESVRVAADVPVL